MGSSPGAANFFILMFNLGIAYGSRIKNESWQSVSLKINKKIDSISDRIKKKPRQTKSFSNKIKTFFILLPLDKIILITR